MIYNIVSPFKYEISGNSHMDAIKQFIKLNYELNINRMIIQDRQRYMQANVNYYRNNGQKKVGIDMYPVNYIPFINNDKNLPYNIILKTKQKEEEPSKNDNDNNDEKKIAYKMIVPQLAPIMPKGPLIFPNYLPTVYNVYKNNNETTDTKLIVPLLSPRLY